MHTPSFVNKILNYSEKLPSIVLPKHDNVSDVCICKHFVRKHQIKRITAENYLSKPCETEQFRFVNEASIVTYKPIPTFSFWKDYRPGCGITYFEQAFYNVREIGSGDFGIVYAATYRGDGQRYAVKKMRYTYSGETNRRSLQREAFIHEQFDDCPGILRYYGAWEERDQLYMQVELCRNSLANIKYCRKCVNSKQVTKFAADILIGVQALHNKNVLHFDIKPENILITNDGRCKLGDFGVALQLSVDDLKDVDEGDARYLAREVLNNKPTLAADIFSIGLTLLELAAKVDLPSHGTENHNIRNGIIKREWLDAVDEPVLRALIVWMISSDPIKRPTAAEALEVLGTLDNKKFISQEYIIVMILLFVAMVIVGFYSWDF